MAKLSEVRDIRFPKKQKKSLPYPPRPPEKPVKKMPRRSILIGATILLAIVVGAGSYIAGQKFNVSKQAERSTPLIGEPLDNILKALQSGTDAVGGVRDISVGAVALLNMAGEARSRLPDFISGKGSEMVRVLADMNGQLKNLIQGLDKLAASDSGARNRVPLFTNYLAWRSELVRGETLLDGVINVLNSPGEHHFIIVLGNTSEIRPGGGFIGSFADVTVASGTVENIAVRDINEVDTARSRKIIPPKPLQAITARWHTADSNWFFDYPESAKKTLQFMSESSLYATTTVNGIAAVTPQVIKDILDITGPVKLKNGTEITSDNFLVEIQRDVQAGQAGKTGNPKAILSEIVRELRTRLASLSPDKEDALWSRAKNWIVNKDVMIFMRDKKIAGVLASYGADGGVYGLPDKFTGDYLAVVNANIGGGKTDLYIAQNISLTSRLDEQGIVHDQLKIIRTHNGNHADEWWYKTTNWDYLQIFTPAGASAEGAGGLGRRIITPRDNYKKGYETDPDLAAIEKTSLVSGDGKLQVLAESGRNVFATWQKLLPGESKSVELNYKRPLVSPPADGSGYTFVFESQSGASSSLDILLAAPVGFIWKENSLPVYEYKADHPPGRLVIDLTLEKKQ